MNDREYFDSAAEKWDDMVTHDAGRINELLDAIRVKANGDVLDVGSGTGVMIPYLLERTSGRITALDVSPKMLEVSLTKNGNDRIDYVCCDALEYTGASFDAIICYSMFPHFADKQRAIMHLASLLRPGGVLAIAHSQSRERINAIHSNGFTEEARLPPADIIRGWFEAAGLLPGAQIDSEIFLCCARARGW